MKVHGLVEKPLELSLADILCYKKGNHKLQNILVFKAGLP